MACFGLGMWSFSLITSDWGWQQLLIPQILRGFPQVFCVAPAVSLGLGSLPPERLKYASGLFNMMRNLGGAVGIAVSGAVLNDRTNFHFLILASNLTTARPQTQNLLTTLQSQMGTTINAPRAALQELWNLTYAQAATLAYADAFRAIALAFVAAVCLAPLLRQVTPTAAPVSEH
jgi:DHA2 family multidrug resistance protein